MITKFNQQISRLWQYSLKCVKQYTNSKYSIYILFLVAFAESLFFPIPPDVLLIPMALAKPSRAFFYAMVTTIGSVVGGIGGYILGYFIFDSVTKDIIINYGYLSKFLFFENLYQQYGIMITFIAGFSPIPYKVATIASGFLQANIIYFIIISIISRGLRFFLLASLIKFYYYKKQVIKVKDFYGLIKVISIILIVLFIIYLLLTLI